MAASPTPAHDGEEVPPHSVARHVVFGLEPGMPAYRRGCRCMQCKSVNSKRMRAWREKRAEQEHPERYLEDPAPPAPEAPAFIRIDKLPQGTVTTALLQELPAVDGASPFQETIKAMMLKAALVIDNADVMERLDLLNSMQIRVRDGIHMLNPASKPASGADLGAELDALGAP